MKSIKVLNTRVDVISKKEVLDKIQKLLLADNGEQKQLVTTNPEFVLEAQKNDQFREIINNSWLSVCDGYGIRWAGKYLETKNKKQLTKNSQQLTKSKKQLTVNKKQLTINSQQLTESNQQKTINGQQKATSKRQNKLNMSFVNCFLFFETLYWALFNSKKLDVINEVVTGADLVEEVVKLAVSLKEKKFNIFLFGAEKDVPQRTANFLAEKYGLKVFDNFVSFHQQKLFNFISYSVPEDENYLQKINLCKTDILFVALNHPRAQVWIAENLCKMPSVKLATGIGGSFDYLVGKTKRAPQKLRGRFEWLYRLYKQPSKRIKRIWQATIVFIYNIIKY